MNKCVFKHILTTLAMYGASSPKDKGHGTFWGQEKRIGSWELVVAGSGEFRGQGTQTRDSSQWQ